MMRTGVRGAAILLLSSGNAVAQFPREDPFTQRVTTYLFETSMAESELDADWLELALADLGPTALPSLFATLARGHYERASLFAGPTSEALTGAQRRATLHAIVRQPGPALRAFLYQAAIEDVPDSWRVVALEVAGEIGRRDDLRLVTALGWPAGEEPRASLPIQRAAQSAYGSIFARDPQAVHDAHDLFGYVHPFLRGPLVQAIGRSGPGPGMQALGRFLGVFDEVDALVLLELGRVSGQAGAAADAFLLDRFREYLLVSDPRIVQLTIPILANLRDDESAAHLVHLLRHGEESVKRQAHSALCSVTGLRMKNDPRVWETWLRSESTWHETQSAEVLEALDESDPGRVAWAMLQIGPRRLHQGQLTESLVPVLSRPEAELVSMAASALGRLGSKNAIPYLLDRLGSPDPMIRQACGAALVQITGKDLPADPQAWVGVEF